MRDDVIIRYIDLPCTIRGMTVYEDDFYSVYINARLSYEEQRRTIQHELMHIGRSDFDRQMPIGCIEDMEIGESVDIVFHRNGETLGEGGC